MAKNIVVCWDGTRNQYGDRNTTFYGILERNAPDQVAFYDPSVGTFCVNPALTYSTRILAA